MTIIGSTEISYNIEKIIREANETLLLVTPYLKIHDRLRHVLKDSIDRCGQSFILVRKNAIDKDEMNWLRKHPNLIIIEVENLHAKCYINEEMALLTSMNLYEYSQINNHELGTLLSKDNNSREMRALLDIVLQFVYTDHPLYDKFEAFIDRNSNFSMRDLYNDLHNQYDKGQKGSYYKPKYESLCDVVREYQDFNDDLLYQDKSAILRSTVIGRTLYNRIKLHYRKLNGEV